MLRCCFEVIILTILSTRKLCIVGNLVMNKSYTIVFSSTFEVSVWGVEANVVLHRLKIKSSFSTDLCKCFICMLFAHVRN